ncbi:SLC13 family permease [Solicola sp. PLA-1-18]|uniref:SLC13 family permease n=1 Tax=Solicola sp. PLA-1-18 TaxID=3380532 RepID=UPI003B764DF3
MTFGGGTRPRVRWEVTVGTAGVAIALLTGAISVGDALDEAGELLPVIAFLVAIMVLAQACAAEGLFAALGARVAVAGRRSGPRFLALSFVVAALVTTTLSLDATAVLLTPVLVVAARAVGRPSRPVSYATVRLSNSASTLLPISNLTNLLVFASTGLTFLGFAAAMAPVWVVAIVAEYVVLRLAFRRDLAAPADAAPQEPPPVPRVALGVVVAVLAGFAAGSPFDVAPFWPAAVGAVVLVWHARRRGVVSLADVGAAANVPFAYFVMCWAIVVIAVGHAGVDGLVGRLLPGGDGVLALVGVALLAMVLAGVVNNLPATLVLLPLVAPLGPAALLALLVGVNVGANLTYAGSLANLLWRSGLRAQDAAPSARTFHLLGLTTPLVVVLCAAVLGLWTGWLW